MKITSEIIDTFLKGKDPQKQIVNIECDYNDREVTIISRNDNNKRIITKEPFFPFVWATQKGAASLYGNDKSLIKQKLREHNIACKGLNIYNQTNETTDRMENGYRVLFYSCKACSYTRFLKFFKDGGIDIYNSNKQFLCVSPVEQFLIQTGKRQFKEFEDYDNLLRFQFDLETDGLNPYIQRINQIGIRTNKGLEHIIHVTGNDEEELKRSEIESIEEFFYYIGKIDPDVISGHNSENFDFWYLMVRCQVLGISFEELTSKYLEKPIYKKKKKTVLKLGGEVEYFNQTVIPNRTVTDSLHAVRRAQAIDSNLKSANLKYVAEYAKVKKPNRVYIPGDKIKDLWADKFSKYTLNEENGEWKLLKKDVENQTETLNSNINIVTGDYIADRYLMDDLYETDKVELTYNQSNFLLSKILPTTFQKACTMGTAGTWKLLLLAWSYENNLAVPMFASAGAFTGGLSRLFKVGFLKKIVKLDFNSLYPSITLTWKIFPDLDITGIFEGLLNHILTEREKFKGLMKTAGKKVKSLEKELKEFDKKTDEYKKILLDIERFKLEESSNDKKQLPFKIFGNSFFGAYGAPNIFPWGDLMCAENITCIGRQCLRLMAKWFTERGFEVVICDTDGMNFSYENVDLTYEYISNGLNRNTVKDKKYIGIEAYVAEFNDLYMREKMGLGIDEYAPATINFSRKNYADLLESGKIKLVGNSIKSKKMPTFIEKFLDENIKLLLDDKGYEFLLNYYDYVEKIYNGNIPLKDIASKGKIKKTLEEYKKDIMIPNKSGGSKGRQAWYELCIEDNITVNAGDTIYYVNIGTKKTEGDVKKEPVYKIDEDGNYVYQDKLDKDGNLEYTKRGKVKQERIQIAERIILNCIRIDNDIIDSEDDVFGTEERFEKPIVYNAPKYVEQFNKKIKPLLVCFSPEIRDNILVSKPDEKNYYTQEQTKLCSGFPNKPVDQDTYEQLMTLEDKEISFWLKKNEEPVFIDELSLNWDEVIKDYNERQEIIKTEECLLEKSRFDEIVNSITQKDINDFIDNDDSTLLSELSKFLILNTNNEFISQKHNVKIGSLDDILNKNFFETVDDE